MLTPLAIDKLTEQGQFKDEDDVREYVNMLEQVYEDPDRPDLRFKLGLSDDILDSSRRSREIFNWLAHICAQ